MKKTPLIILFLAAIIALFSFLSSPVVLAQGTCTCWNNGVSCVVVSDSCDNANGYSPVCGSCPSCTCSGSSSSGGGGITNPALPDLIGNATPQDAIALLIARFLAAALSLGAILFLAYFIVGAYKWLTSGGDKNQLSVAQQHITQAVIGLVILASLFAFTNIIGPLLGINFLSITWPSFY